MSETSLQLSLLRSFVQLHNSNDLWLLSTVKVKAVDIELKAGLLNSY